MKKIAAFVLSAVLLLTALPVAVRAENDESLSAQNGRLLISEAGEYTLTGSVKGTVWVDPGQGNVTLILDDIAIDGGNGAGIVAASGESLTIRLADGSQNTVTGGADSAYPAAIYTAVDTAFEGSGSLTVIGNYRMGIYGKGANLTFSSGSYAIQAVTDSVYTSATLTISGANVVDLATGHRITAAYSAANTVVSSETDGAAAQVDQLAPDAATPASESPADEDSPAALSVMIVQTGNSGKLNMRKDARTSSELTGQYANGTEVKVLKMDGDWCQVEIGGTVGYVMTKYLAEAQKPATDTADESTFNDHDELPPAETPMDEPAPEPSQEQQEGNLPAEQPAEKPESNADENIPALPAESGQGQNPPKPPAWSDGQTPPAFPDGEQGQNPPQLPSDMSGWQPEGQMPGNPFGMASTVDEPGEIIASTAENSAASLEADMENAETYTVTDEEGQVKISDSGTYVVTGTSSDGNITVKKGTTGVVLVLEDLDLTSTTGATVSVNKEAEVKIIISGAVTLTDAENPEDEESADAEVADAYDGAAMKFKANSQVYLTGDGTLTINGTAKNGIATGDDSVLTVDGVTVNITAANDGINANYDVTLLDGSFTIEAADDAIHADHILTIGSEDGNGPTVRITGSNEGLEATVINLFGGEVSVVSADDAVNAANKDGLYADELVYSFNMTGGQLMITSQGDGIDSNGNVNLIGGEASISSASAGGEAGIDYDGEFYISEAFSLNNGSGTSGPDGMPGGMGNEMGGPGMMNGPRMDESQPPQMPAGQMEDGAFPGAPGQMGPGAMPGQPMNGMGQ